MSDAPPSADLRIRVVLIHHGDPARLHDARSTSTVVADALAPFGDVAAAEVWRQPPLRELGSRAVARSRLRQWRLERRWAGYLGVRRRWVLSSGLLTVRFAQLLLPAQRRRAGRQVFIERCLAAKHALAWRDAYEGDVDLLAVLEDDARADSASTAKVRALVATAGQLGELSTSFVDLAGGFGLDELRLTQLAERLPDGVVRIARPASNTSCAYLLGRDVIAALAELTMSDPAVTELPADWIMNLCFLRLEADPARQHIQCLHSAPNALSHGSFTGEVPSSIRA